MNITDEDGVIPSYLIVRTLRIRRQMQEGGCTMRTAMLVLAMALLLPYAAAAQVCTDPVDGLEYPAPGPFPVLCDPDAVRPCDQEVDPDCVPGIPVTTLPVCTWIDADPRYVTYRPGPEYETVALAWAQTMYEYELCRLHVWWAWIEALYGQRLK